MAENAKNEVNPYEIYLDLLDETLEVATEYDPEKVKKVRSEIDKFLESSAFKGASNTEQDFFRSALESAMKDAASQNSPEAEKEEEEIEAEAEVAPSPLSDIDAKVVSAIDELENIDEILQDGFEGKPEAYKEIIEKLDNLSIELFFMSTIQEPESVKKELDQLKKRWENLNREIRDFKQTDDFKKADKETQQQMRGGLQNIINDLAGEFQQGTQHLAELTGEQKAKPLPAIPTKPATQTPEEPAASTTDPIDELIGDLLEQLPPIYADLEDEIFYYDVLIQETAPKLLSEPLVELQAKIQDLHDEIKEYQQSEAFKSGNEDVQKNEEESLYEKLEILNDIYQRGNEKLAALQQPAAATSESPAPEPAAASTARARTATVVITPDLNGNPNIQQYSAARIRGDTRARTETVKALSESDTFKVSTFFNIMRHRLIQAKNDLPKITDILTTIRDAKENFFEELSQKSQNSREAGLSSTVIQAAEDLIEFEVAKVLNIERSLEQAPSTMQVTKFDPEKKADQLQRQMEDPNSNLSKLITKYQKAKLPITKKRYLNRIAKEIGLRESNNNIRGLTHKATMINDLATLSRAASDARAHYNQIHDLTTNLVDVPMDASKRVLSKAIAQELSRAQKTEKIARSNISKDADMTTKLKSGVSEAKGQLKQTWVKAAHELQTKTKSAKESLQSLGSKSTSTADTGESEQQEAEQEESRTSGIHPGN